MKRLLHFLRLLPRTVRLSGGVLNPWLTQNLRASWRQTGPPVEPLLPLTEEEMDAFLEAIEGERV